MRQGLLAIVASIFLSQTAWAQGAGASGASAEAKAAPAGAPGDMDMTKVGPWSRKPTNEAATKKEIAAFFKEEEELSKKDDFDAVLARIDFPVTMITDNSKGVAKVEAWSKE